MPIWYLNCGEDGTVGREKVTFFVAESFLGHTPLLDHLGRVVKEGEWGGTMFSSLFWLMLLLFTVMFQGLNVVRQHGEEEAVRV